jgi:ABC-type lipoprotein export system ATPase subunit
MTIKEIVEIDNPNETKFKVLREKQDVFVPDISNLNISRRNGMVYVLSGSGGSGKTNLL